MHPIFLIISEAQCAFVVVLVVVGVDWDANVRHMKLFYDFSPGGATFVVADIAASALVTTAGAAGTSFVLADVSYVVARI